MSMMRIIKKIRCEFCSRSFWAWSSLVYHVRREHHEHSGCYMLETKR